MAHATYNQPQYTDSSDAFNPYDARQQYSHEGYNNNYGGNQYTDEPSFHNPHNLTVAGPRPRPDSMQSAFDNETDEGHGIGARSQGKAKKSFKAYRYNSQENLWKKGGGVRCFGRFLCCTIMIVIFLLVSIVLTIILWVRPPNVGIGSVTPQVADGSVYTINSTGIDLNLGVDISVDNPNFFSVSLKHLKLEIFYPINNTAIGGGQKDNIVIRANQLTNFTFPFALQYNIADDPGHAVLTDLAAKCVANTPVGVNYKITLGLHIIVATVSPVISNSFSFQCPLSASDINKIINNGIS